ncbi:probable WRKY transcription factor 43 isoform X2 [Rutidosis leptorrhynchoides]|uniref:probable WRKY transcription factor 43 isoform X2 n=1 Tax=Rutidosis leptorrhynchoides TaxID=125765 RepID=UPI003A9A4CD2
MKIKHPWSLSIKIICKFTFQPPLMMEVSLLLEAVALIATFKEIVVPTYWPEVHSDSEAIYLSIEHCGVQLQDQSGTKAKVAFKTQSQVEILDDGFKWRKYGKKMVKNSPNPRNYYRCSAEGCSVKKRVERDIDDVRFVITTYEGIHNHQRI